MVSGGSHFRYSDEVRNRVLTQLEAGARPSDIASALGVSKPFISQVKTRGAVDPEVLQRRKRTRGRPPKLPPYAVEAAQEYMKKHPQAERSAVLDNLKEQFGIEVHLTTIGRLLRKFEKAGILPRRVSSTASAESTSALEPENPKNATNTDSNNTSAAAASRNRKPNQNSLAKPKNRN